MNRSLRESGGSSDLITPKEAAKRLRVSIETLAGLAHDGELVYVNVGRGRQRVRMMFTQQDLEEFIDRRKRGAAVNPSSTNLGFSARRRARLQERAEANA
jgi:excisionase family DNA binding protein